MVGMDSSGIMVLKSVTEEKVMLMGVNGEKNNNTGY